MKSKFLKATLVGLVLSVSNLASAVLIDMGSITRDTDSGLDWLDLTETKGMSYNDVTAQLIQGGSLEGYRYATLLEVEGFLTAAGGTGPDYLYGGRIRDFPLGGWSEELLALWGTTIPASSTYNALFIHGEFKSVFTIRIVSVPAGEKLSTGEICLERKQCLERIQETISRIAVGNLEAYNPNGATPSATARPSGFSIETRIEADMSSTDWGSALVRMREIEVPEPSTLAIFALGMIGLASRQLKKQS
jgi:hypothetical protein